jgi:hypothetical protein
MEIKICRVQYFEQQVIFLLRIKDDLNLFVLLFAEVESLRARISTKDNEIENMRKS